LIYFFGVWALVQAALSAHFVLEMFDCIRNVNVAPCNLRFPQGAIENLPRRADERSAAEIFAVTRLLANEHEARVCSSLTGHHVCRKLIQGTASTACLRAAQLSKRADRYASTQY
jgi:hypothetical protein